MLKNISIRFDPIEDRMALRMVVQSGSDAPQEHWLHLTRRLCGVWRQDLQAMVDMSAQAPERLDAPAKASISQAHHQAMARQAQVRTEPAPSPADGPTPQPVLVTRIVCGRRKADGRWLMRFERRDLPSLSLVLSSQTLHALIDALTRRIQSASWALPSLPFEQKALEQPSTATHLH